ncbi:hypothetical protein ACFWXO_30650 [Kitasatospora sp. NPDC059088]|uniref:hypothetical protein n=1 Tax=Kitasatospora sp. NPDC059088 TaxID=3346722 RepID=UPI0036C900E9
MLAKNSALATACCALLLAVPLALAGTAAAAGSGSSTGTNGTGNSSTGNSSTGNNNTSINTSSNNGPKTPQEAAACKSVTGALLGGFGGMLGNAVCVVQPADRG